MASSKTHLLGTGLSGLVGSTLTRELASKYEFTNLDLTAGVDILDTDQLEQAFINSSAQSVLHLAAFTDVNQANQQQGDKSGLSYRLNVIGTRNIATACAKHGRHLIYVSTDFVFSGTKSTPYIESDSPHPIEWYGQTKYWGEKEVSKHLPSALIMRIAYPYGGNHPQRQDLIQKIKNKLINNSLPPQFDDNLITPTYIPDIARAIDYFVSHKSTGIYHVVGSTALSSLSLAKKVAKLIGKDPAAVKSSSVKEYNQTAARPFQAYLYLSNRKYRTETHHQPLTIESGLARL